MMKNIKIIFLTFLILLFSACEKSKDSTLTEDSALTDKQEQALDFFLSPFSKMLSMEEKLSFIPQSLDSKERQALLDSIIHKDTQTLWQEALEVPLGGQYGELQDLEFKAKTWEEKHDTKHKNSKVQEI